MIHARVEAERNISSAADADRSDRSDRKEVRAVVELDQFKTLMNAYEEPLAEMRDSL